MHVNLKSSTEQLNAIKERVAKHIQAQWGKAEAQGRKVLNELGAELDAEDHSLSAVVARIRAKNPTLKVLAGNLDLATYDLRGRLNWDLSMMSAYAKMRAEQTLERDIKPRMNEYLSQVEEKIKAIKGKSATAPAEANAQPNTQATTSA